MAGSQDIITIEDRDVKKKIGQFLKKADGIEAPLKSWGEYMLRRIDDRFSEEKDPDGSPWKRLSPVTLLKKKGKKILTESSNLRGRIVYSTTKNSIAIGTNVIYAAIHQLGGEAGRGRKVTIPDRPFLGVNQEDKTELIQTLKEHLVDS